MISEIEILDEDAAASYRELAAASIAAYGGRYLARAAEAVVVEGGSTHPRIAVVELDSMEQIRNRHASPEYTKALRVRGTAPDHRLMFVNSVDQPSETP